jgi:hypothetical protein
MQDHAAIPAWLCGHLEEGLNFGGVPSRLVTGRLHFVPALQTCLNTYRGCPRFRVSPASRHPFTQPEQNFKMIKKGEEETLKYVENPNDMLGSKSPDPEPAKASEILGRGYDIPLFYDTIS